MLGLLLEVKAMRMKILQLCKKFPYPLKDGEVIAINNLTKGFHQLGQEVTVLAINTNKHFFDRSRLPQQQRQLAAYRDVFVNTDLRVKDALLNLFTRDSYNIQRFDSPAFRRELQVLLQKERFDIIQLEGLYLAPYLPIIRHYASEALVVMRAHNVEFEIWERLALHERNMVKRLYLQLLARRMKAYELKHLNEYDALVAISSKDAQYFKDLGCSLPMHVTPTGVDLEKLRMERSAIEYPSLFHLGALDWLPNQEGLWWFLEEVWPKLHERHPNLCFYVAGRGMPPAFEQLQMPGVKVLGEVEDAVAFMNSKAISIVPLHSGSGMRIKIIEALALGKTVVSTSVGMEGIDAQDGQEALIANTAEEFIAKIEKCLAEPAFFEKIGQNAHIFALEKYDNLDLTQQLLHFYRQQLAHKNALQYDGGG
jgi:glycosyltransferase involved in cell wall biosynthesis